jgi:hypothetical protein
MALESETVETLEAAASHLTPADRAGLVDRLIGTLDSNRKSKKLGQRKSSAGNPKLKMEASLYFSVPKPSPN